MSTINKGISSNKRLANAPAKHIAEDLKEVVAEESYETRSVLYFAPHRCTYDIRVCSLIAQV